MAADAPNGVNLKESRPPRRRRWWIVGAILALVVIVVAAVVVGVTIGRSSAAVPLRLVPASKPGPDPFTQSAAANVPISVNKTVTRKSAELRSAMPVAKGTRTLVAQGTSPGLYGGSGNTRVCDAQKLVGFLQANWAKAAVWAQVLGIQPSHIGMYVSWLTPVLLNSDTLVENHGYQAGHATAFPAVLQAGTAVFVDARGVPRVKCNCGNPLTDPTVLSARSASIVGTPWASYAPGAVVVVRGGATSSALSVVNVATGEVYRQPVGVGANIWVAATDSSSLNVGATDQSDVWTSTDGAAWTKVTTLQSTWVRGLAWGAGRWLAIGQLAESQADTSEILSSTDLATWTVVATVPGTLRSIAYGDGRFVAVGKPSTLVSYDAQGHMVPNGAASVFTSAEGTNWSGPAAVPTAGLDGFVSVSYGASGWTALAAMSTEAPAATYASVDSRTWAAEQTFNDQAGADIVYGDGTWLVAGESANPPDPQTSDPSDNDVFANTSRDGKAWVTSSPDILKHQLAYALAFGAGRWLIGTEAATLPNPGMSMLSTKLLASEDGRSWSPVGYLSGPVGAMSYGGAPVTLGPAAMPSPIPPSSTEPPGGECSTSSLQAALSAAGPSGTVTSEVFCSGSWAVAGVTHTDTKSQTTMVFEWTNGAWIVQDRGQVCDENVLPPDLVQQACQTN